MGRAKQRLSSEPQTLPAAYISVVKLAVARFQGKLFDNTDFLIMTYCLAEAAGETKLCQAIVPTMVGKASKQPKVAPVVGICLDAQRPLVDRIQQLHNTQNPRSRFPLQFYLTRLSEVQRQSPRIRRIGMEIAIESRDYPLALDHFEHLPETVQNQPQVMFWQAWSLAATRQDDQARAVLERLIDERDASAWATPARDYLAGLRGFDAHLDEQAARFLKVTEVLKDDLSLLQARLQFTHKDGARFVIHLCSNARGNLFEAAIEKNGRLAVAYRTTAAEALFYLQPYPWPDLPQRRLEQADFTMILNMMGAVMELFKPPEAGD